MIFPNNHGNVGYGVICKRPNTKQSRTKALKPKKELKVKTPFNAIEK